jgi:PhnB protein
MATINPYLNFPGNTEEAFTFYKSVFGGEFIMLQRFKDTPESSKVPAFEQDKIMHIALPVGPQNILMATDALESMGQQITSGTNFHISIGTESQAEADRLFAGLAEGGRITVPLDKMYWGDYFGMLTDKFGIQWMVSYSPDLHP